MRGPRPGLLAAALVVAGCSRSGSLASGPPPEGEAGARAPEGTRPDDAGRAAVVGEAFPTVEAAFDVVLASSPRVLAVGEAHAQKGSEAFRSSTSWFSELLVPRLAGRASHLFLELWAPDPRCQQAVKQVAEAQKPVVAEQAATNPNAYVALGSRAKAFGIQPHLLRPSCDDFARLADAGGPDVQLGAMLGLVRDLTERDVRAALDAGGPGPDGGPGERMVVAYGGAMHNDLDPPEAMAPYAFGRALEAAAGGRYVELDLVVPEYVKDTPAWNRLPWVGAFRARPPAPGVATLYRTGPKSFALLLPAAARP